MDARMVLQLVAIAVLFGASLSIPSAEEADCKDCENFTIHSANQGPATQEVCAPKSSGGYPTCVSGYSYSSTWQELKDGEGAPCVHSPEMFACPPLE